MEPLRTRYSSRKLCRLKAAIDSMMSSPRLSAVGALNIPASEPSPTRILHFKVSKTYRHQMRSQHFSTSQTSPLIGRDNMSPRQHPLHTTLAASAQGLKARSVSSLFDADDTRVDSFRCSAAGI